MESRILDIRPRMGRICQTLIGFSLSAYTFALVLPFTTGDQFIRGIQALGFVGVLPWFANPLGLCALILSFSRNLRYAWMFSIPAFGLALMLQVGVAIKLNVTHYPWLLYSVVFKPALLQVIEQSRGLGTGYYVWVASLLCLCLANLKQGFDPSEVQLRLRGEINDKSGDEPIADGTL